MPNRLKPEYVEKPVRGWKCPVCGWMLQRGDESCIGCCAGLNWSGVMPA